MRLRTRLTLVLVLAALVPMLVVATIAVGVVLGSLDRGLRDETERQREVGVNLILRTVERLGDDALRLAGSGDLTRALGTGPPAVRELLARQGPQLPSSLIQVFDAGGRAVSEFVVGGDTQRFEGLAVPGDGDAVAVGRAWRKRVTLEVVGERLVVRAVAPVVDTSLALEGVVVLSVPLDGEFGDGIKGALGSDMLVAARTSAVASSTFLDRDGRRLPDLPVRDAVRERVALGRKAATTERIGLREYVVAWTGLVDHEQRLVGVYGVAVDRNTLVRAQQVAFRSLAVGGALALGFALVLAAVISRRLGRPIARLHRGALAVSQGDLDQPLEVTGSDEIAELARAFGQMTTSLKENQQRLAARMREIVALHDAGRAMSSVIELDQVVGKVVDAVVRTFDASVCALWLHDAGGLTMAASRSRRGGLAGDAPVAAARLEPLAREVLDVRVPLRFERVGEEPRHAEVARAAGIDGSLLAAPLERKGQIVGAIVVGRLRDERPFGEPDTNLLATFADQAAAAIENARLYFQVVGASEELERKVDRRTSELTASNADLARALGDLRDAQSQLILSERLAGLGMLVAGVAHEINSPSAAIRGAVDSMGELVERLTAHLRSLGELELPPTRRTSLARWIAEHGRTIAARRLPTGPAARRVGKELRAQVSARWPAELAEPVARVLAETGIEPGAELDGLLAELADGPPGMLAAAAGYLAEYVQLHRNVLTIHSAIARVTRIVGSLKSYSHLDQAASRTDADVHEGIETTLVILDHALRGIQVVRSYGDLPRIPIYVDELNQVWTNLIQNAAQALGGAGAITLETARAARGDRAGVEIRVIDDGQGIPDAVQARIFEPFFTTKPKGEGTGLGLGIVRQIVDKHGGEVTCASRPGRTCFAVWLPAERPTPGATGEAA